MENNNEDQIPIKVPTLAEDIQEFNRKLDQAVEKLVEWKSNLANLQAEFTEKMVKKTRELRIE